MTKESEIEREAIVRRLLKDAEAWADEAGEMVARFALKKAAQSIERGDHLKERG